MKCRTLVSVAMYCYAVTVLEAQVKAPQVGIAKYADSSVRAIYGVDSAFVVDRQVLGSADAISFSNSGGLLSENGRIQLLGSDMSLIGEYDSAESAPVLNIEDGLQSAVAWLPSQQALLHWNGNSFVRTGVNGGAFQSVSSVRVKDQSSAELLFSTQNMAFAALFSLQTGDLISISQLPGIVGPAYQHGSFVLFHDQEGLEIESEAGVRRTIPLAASDLTFERMSAEWLHLSSRAAGQNWALHLNSQVAHLSELPPSPASSPVLPTGTISEGAK